MIVEYYQHLLGSAQSSVEFSQDVIDMGPKLDTACHGALVAVSDEDIRSALWAIENMKSPGPDGYNAFFFKQSWGWLKRM